MQLDKVLLKLIWVNQTVTSKKTILREKDKVGDTIAYIKTLLKGSNFKNYSISQE